MDEEKNNIFEPETPEVPETPAEETPEETNGEENISQPGDEIENEIKK